MSKSKARQDLPEAGKANVQCGTVKDDFTVKDDSTTKDESSVGDGSTVVDKDSVSDSSTVQDNAAVRDESSSKDTTTSKAKLVLKDHMDDEEILPFKDWYTDKDKRWKTLVAEKDKVNLDVMREVQMGPYGLG
jgi:hypothetical protein